MFVSCQVAPLRKALEKCREDNLSLSERLQQTLETKDKLETKLQRVTDELEKTSHLLKELRTARCVFRPGTYSSPEGGSQNTISFSIALVAPTENRMGHFNTLKK